MAVVHPRYRTFTQRCISAIIDSLVFLPLNLLVDPLKESAEPFAFAGWHLLEVVFTTAYFVYMHGRWGQTLGKMVMGVKVLPLDEKNTIGYKRAFLRECIWLSICLIGLTYMVIGSNSNDRGDDVFGEIVFFPAILTLTLELLTMLFNHKRRSIHDLLAGTVVVNLENTDPPKKDVVEAMRTT